MSASDDHPFHPWRYTLFAFLWFLLLVGVVALFWPHQDDLSALIDSGAEYEAEILRDVWGVPHILGPTPPDVAYGLAYAHAEDDFLTIQQALVAARGEIGAVYGPDAAANDYMVQLLRVWDIIDEKYEIDLSPEMREILDAYAAGLNRYAAGHENDAFIGLFPVTGRDIAAGFVHKVPLFSGLDGVLGDVFSNGCQVESEQAATADFAFLFPDGVDLYGSNTIAVGPSLAAEGQTLLAVNSHQPWEGLVTWYEAHVQSEDGWDTVGGTFPGFPMIAHGHNRDLGWAFTVNSPDLSDVFTLELNPDNPDQYRVDGEWLEFEVRPAPITVKLLGNLSWTVEEEVVWSIFGPTIRHDDHACAIRYAALGELDYIEQFYQLNRASSLEEWREVMGGGSLPMFNAGYADKEGNIYYLYNGRIPVRAAGYDWTQPVPGTSRDVLWTEYWPFDDLPQVLNPPSGFVQNANSTPFESTVGPGNPDPDDFPAWLGIETQMTNRGLRALELFANDDEITAVDFQIYKYDMAYSEESDMAEFVERLVAAEALDRDEERLGREILAAWNMETTPDNRQAPLAIFTLYYIFEAAETRDDVKISGKLTESVVPDDVLQESFQQALELLQKHHGRLDPLWQEANRLRRGDLDLGLGGGPDILHAIYGDMEDGRFIGNAGDSYIMLVNWDENGQVSSHSIHQFGSATLNESSPHYNDQSPLFVKRQLKPVWLDETDIRANLERAYRPGEE